MSYNSNSFSIKSISLIVISFLFFGCHQHSKENTHIVKKLSIVNVDEAHEQYFALDSAKLNINFKKRGSYGALKNKIIEKRNRFKQLYDINSNKAIDSASGYIYTALINDIVPHWYGTTWDFNGHTNIPNKGDIACGYFVSTTLKHLGFNLNRYTMAQQAGLVEAQFLQTKTELKQFSNISFKTLKLKLNSVYNDGLYFVGLDNHVGYVLIKDGELYFLHSSYYEDKVMIECAKTSPCFSSSYYVFAEISTNKNLLKKWILNIPLETPRL